MLQPSWFHSPFPISQTILQALLVPLPSFKSFLSKACSKMHLHTFAMLPLVPLIYFHGYSILGAPQTFELWSFLIPICALGFLLATLRPSYDQTHAVSSKSGHLSQESLHGYYETALSTPPLTDYSSLLCQQATTTFKLITWWIFL